MSVGFLPFEGVLARSLLPFQHAVAHQLREGTELGIAQV